MSYCVVYGCSEKQLGRKGLVTFHRFPKDEKRRQLWGSKIGRKDFRVTDYSKICSKHFTDDSFDRQRAGRTWLKKNAVPTLFELDKTYKRSHKRKADENIQAPSKRFSGDSYFEAAEDKAFDATPDSGIHELGVTDPEQRAKLEEEWRLELAKTEEEISTLRQVLSVKVKYAQELKQKLGITPWRELKQDVEQSFKNIQETPALKEVGGRLVEWNSAITSAPIYQKTSQTVKTAAEKTTSVLGTLGASMSKKLGEVKNSSTFRSFEERMGSAYTNVRSRMGTPRSTSLYNFDEAVPTQDRRGVASSASTPTIPERDPIP